jgi:beta-lactamase superfamily II metal-dependent hydrolase
MKLTVFHAADGDCLLLTSSDRPPRRLLVDGGRGGSYESNTRAFLGKLRDAGEKIDVICVSHIDDDHITGILRLVEDEVDWRAFEFLQTDDSGTRPPQAPRPPEVGEVWHNGLFRLVGDDIAPTVEGTLENVATVLAGSPSARLRELASELNDLATGERSSMELSRRLSTEQLGIVVNPRAAGPLAKRGTPQEAAAGEKVVLGSLAIFLLGPSDDDIVRLRTVWQEWIDGNRNALVKLQAEMLADEERLGTLSPRVVANPLIDAALGEGLKSVTAANLASLMLLVEEGPTSVLLTGDGVSSEILDGLDYHGKLDANGRIHVNVLKVQHHGALANVTQDFVKRVTADHYVFCGNGAHDNPEREVVDAFANARFAGIDGSGPVGPAAPFAFWFTTGANTPDSSAGKKRQRHMKQIEDAVSALRVGHEGRMKATFLTGGHFEIDLPAA